MLQSRRRSGAHVRIIVLDHPMRARDQFGTNVYVPIATAQKSERDWREWEGETVREETWRERLPLSEVCSLRVPPVLSQATRSFPGTLPALKRAPLWIKMITKPSQRVSSCSSYSPGTSATSCCALSIQTSSRRSDEQKGSTVGIFAVEAAMPLPTLLTGGTTSLQLELVGDHHPTRELPALSRFPPLRQLLGAALRKVSSKTWCDATRTKLSQPFSQQWISLGDGHK